MKKWVRGIAALALTLALLSGCAPASDTQPIQTPVPKDIMEQNIDAMGDTVTASAIPEEELRIVSTAPSATEILFALGCGGSIVGVDAASTYPAEAANIEKVGDFNGFDVEKVVSLNPTVVFAGNTLQQDEIRSLKNAGLSVVAVEATYYEDIAASITMIGGAVGRQAQAAALNEELAAVEAAVKEKAAGFAKKPSVYYVMSLGDGGNWTSGEGSFINSVLEMAGGAPVTAGTASEWLDYPPEDLVTADPDLLIVSSWVSEDDLKAAMGYKDLTAVKQGRYCFLNADIIERPGPRISEALQAVQAGIEAFLAGE